MRRRVDTVWLAGGGRWHAGRLPPPWERPCTFVAGCPAVAPAGVTLCFISVSSRLLQVILSLTLNLVLLGGSVVWWSGGSGAASVMLRASVQRVAFSPSLSFAYEACERPQLDETKLDEWGCKVFNKACFDQVSCCPASICRCLPAPT